MGEISRHVFAMVVLGKMRITGGMFSILTTRSKLSAKRTSNNYVEGDGWHSNNNRVDGTIELFSKPIENQ